MFPVLQSSFFLKSPVIIVRGGEGGVGGLTRTGFPIFPADCEKCQVLPHLDLIDLGQYSLR